MSSIKVPVIGFAGVGTGISLGTLTAEVTNKYAGQTGWYAFGVKATVKTALGALFYYGSTKAGEQKAMLSFFAEMIAYGTWGSILADLFNAAYPGGLAGMAEDLLGTTAVMAKGARPLSNQLRKLENGNQMRQPSITRNGGWI